MKLEWQDRITSHADNDYSSYLTTDEGDAVYFAGNNWDGWNNPSVFFGVYLSYRNKGKRASAQFATLEEAKQWCEMHWATGAGDD